MGMSSPYQDETYIGTYAQNADAQAAELSTTGIVTNNPAGYDDAAYQLLQNRDSYISAQEGRASSDQMGTQPGPSSAGTIYTSISHEELYRATHTNIDPSGIFENGRSWNTIGNEYADNANLILKAVSDNRDSWTGPAADTFHAAITALANHEGQVGQAAQSISAQLYVQSEAADTVRNKVPPPTGFDKNAALMSAFSTGYQAFQQDIAQQAQAADAAHAQAADATQTYEQSVTQSVATSPKFAPAPENTPGSAAKGNLGTSASATPGSQRRRASGPTGTAGVGVTASGAPSGVNNIGNSWSPSTAPGTSVTGPTGTTTTSDYSPAPTLDPIPTGLPSDTVSPGAGPNLDVTALPAGGGPGGLGGGSGVGPEGGWSAARARNLLSGNGSGARSGIGAQAAEEAATRSGVAAEAAEGRAGMSGMPGAAGRKKDEDKEHDTAGYLQNNDLHELITGDLGATIKPVLGGEK